GPILALVLLYEMHNVARFEQVGQFLSYARLVRCEHESAGKKLGSGGKKIGNAQLRWAFAEAACLFLRASERARQWKQKQEKKHGPAKVLGILAARLARAVYHMLRKEEAIDEERFWHGQAGAAQACGRRRQGCSGEAAAARGGEGGRILSPHPPSASGAGSVRRKNACPTEGSPANPLEREG